MKKSMKALLAGVLVVPAALAMTACFGGENTEFDRAREMLTSESVVANLNSYTMDIDVAVSATEGSETVEFMTMSTDSLINLSDGLDMQIISNATMLGFPGEEEVSYVSDGIQYEWDSMMGQWAEAGEVTAEEQPNLQYEGLFGELTDAQKKDVDVNIDETVPGIITIKMTMSASVLEDITASAGGDVSASLEGVNWGTAEVEYKIVDGTLNSVSVYVPYSMIVDYLESRFDFSKIKLQEL